MMTIREGIGEKMMENGETWSDIEVSTISGKDLDEGFENSYGMPSCKAFMVWTKNNVYFPVCYDGIILFSSVPRNPDQKKKAPAMIGRW